MKRRTTAFQTMCSEGGLLAPDLLPRVLDPKARLDGTRPEDFGLPQGRAPAGAGASLSELCQVLPAQSSSSVQRLLRELRTEGRVILRGSRKRARWYPVGV